MQLRSQPEGAAVGGEGIGLLCEATPCDVELPRDEPLRLHAVFGKRSLDKTIVVGDDTREVVFAFGAKAPRPRPAKKQVDGELKVPAIFETGTR
mgnify:CR=1 FL=1